MEEQVNKERLGEEKFYPLPRSAAVHLVQFSYEWVMGSGLDTICTDMAFGTRSPRRCGSHSRGVRSDGIFGRLAVETRALPGIFNEPVEG